MKKMYSFIFVVLLCFCYQYLVLGKDHQSSNQTTSSNNNHNNNPRGKPEKNNTTETIVDHSTNHTKSDKPKHKGGDKKSSTYYSTHKDLEFQSLEGQGYRLYQPFIYTNVVPSVKSKSEHGKGKKNNQQTYRPGFQDSTQEMSLLAPPEVWLSSMERTMKYLDSISTIKINKVDPKNTPQIRARQAYLDFISQMITGLAFGSSEKSVVSYLYNGMKAEVRDFDAHQRTGGLDWTYLGKTMIGNKRLDNLRNVTTIVLEKSIPGAFVQTGVWRGGVDMIVRAMFRSFHQAHRPNILCDSFAGLPPGNASVDKLELGWNNNPYMSVPETEVIRNFQQYALQDPNVFFAKGFFNITMPLLRQQVKRIAILRLDGDMYQSTVDVLYNLYDKVEVGGFVIMDDWFGFPSKHAVEDFFHCHNQHVEIISIDSLSVYWQKTSSFAIKYSLYESKHYKC